MPERVSPEDCDDGNECTGNACDDGMCEFPPVADGTACDESNECTVGTCAEGACDSTPVADNTACGDDAGTCQQGSCRVACDEQGIRDAIAAGGGPYTFACDGPTTVVTDAEIAIDNHVILDAEGNLTIDGNGGDHILFGVDGAVELHGWTLRGGDFGIAQGRDNPDADSLTMTNSTVSGAAQAGIGFCADVTLVNSTVSGNRDGVVLVCGCEFSCGATLTLVSSTVSGNERTSISNFGGLTVLANTLIDGDCDGSGRLVSNGYNIESPSNTCSFDEAKGDQFNVTEEQLNLGPLQDNGGGTMTHALLPGSVAIDVTPADMCEVDEDQRGEPRPGGAMCDVGAFEVQP